MKQSHIEINPDTGEKILHCYYPEGSACFNEIITAAYAEHGIEPGKVQVICKPAREMDMVQRLYADHFMEKKR